MVAALYRTMLYMHSPANATSDSIHARYHNIDLPLAEKAFSAQMLSIARTAPSRAN